jgi:putative membrane protein
MVPKESQANFVPLPPAQGYDMNTNLARLRTFQATERTLMAWIRTAISMISFGFTIVKFFEYLRSEKQQHFHLIGPVGVGLILISSGIMCLVVGDMQYRHAVKLQRLQDQNNAFWSFAEYVAWATALVGFVALISVIRSF